MNIKIKKGDFFHALSFTQNVVEKKSTMPILANVLLEADGRRLKVSATDLEVGITLDCPAEVREKGKVTVLSRELFDIIKELPNETIHIEVLDNNWLTISCGRSKFKIVGMSADEFPSIPTGKEGSVYVEDRDNLLDMVKKTSYAISMDETRYNLNGIYFQQLGESDNNLIRMVATDGHRLAISAKTAKSKWKLEKGVIIPRKGIMELKKLLETYDGDFSFRVDEKNMIIEKGNVQLVIRLIDGQFPPYEQVIPKGCKRLATVDKEKLVRALRRISLMANDKTKGVKLAFSPGHIEISSSNPEFGEANEDIDVVYKEETFSAGFNARYFLDILGVLEDDKVVLELKDDVSPCLIRSEFDKGLLNVIMPMRI